MMKKLIPASALALGVIFSGQAFATGATAIINTVQIAPTGGTFNCEALSNNITVQLSANVHGSYACSAAGTAFEAGTCHQTGTNKTQTVDCSWTDNGDGTYTPNVDGCGTDPNGGITTASFTGRLGFYGNSQGGRVGATQFLEAECLPGTVTSLTPNLQ